MASCRWCSGFAPLLCTCILTTSKSRRGIGGRTNQLLKVTMYGYRHLASRLGVVDELPGKHPTIMFYTANQLPFSKRRLPYSSGRSMAGRGRKCKRKNIEADGRSVCMVIRVHQISAQRRAGAKEFHASTPVIRLIPHAIVYFSVYSLENGRLKRRMLA